MTLALIGASGTAYAETVQDYNKQVINRVPYNVEVCTNHSVGGDKSGDMEEYPTLSGGTFDRSKMQELMGYGQSDEGKRELAAVDTIKKAGVTVDQVPEHVTNALTKDYSKLMKALDKKKQGGLG